MECGAIRHTKKNCPRLPEGRANRASLRCDHCGKRDHNIAACPEIVPVAPRYFSSAIQDNYVEDL